jgi:hypothetical protein
MRGRVEVGSVNRSLLRRSKKIKNGNIRNNEFRKGFPMLPFPNLANRSLEEGSKKGHFGNVGKRGQRGPKIQMSLFLLSVFHLLVKQYNANCHFVDERKMLNIALISTTITPSLEYSPDALEGMELRSGDQRDMLAKNSSSSERTDGEEKNEK